MSRANMDKNPDEVAAMFDGVAKRYDLVNDLLSLGQTKSWRRATTKIIDPRPGMKILDLAAGTGSSSEPLAAAGADVIPADFSEGMLEAGRKARPHLPFTKADALNLPFKDGQFDLVTISFGLRNTQNTEKALAEMLRVTKPGGEIVICEFSSPTFGPFRTIYTNYLMRALPAIASKTSSNPMPISTSLNRFGHGQIRRRSPPRLRQLAGSMSLGAISLVELSQFTKPASRKCFSAPR
jgi:demethylmenaquinone methyltransferase/2-methoxy-6-polyprenyl-1,4-benzoquinol methylase